MFVEPRSEKFGVSSFFGQNHHWPCSPRNSDPIYLPLMDKYAKFAQ